MVAKRTLAAKTTVSASGVVTKLSCTTAAWGDDLPAATVSLRLWRTDATAAPYSADELVAGVGVTSVTFYEVWSLLTTEMSHGAKGGDVIVVTGAGFDSSKLDYQCRFRGTTPSSTGSYHTRVAPTVKPKSTTSLTCVSPAWAAVGDDSTMSLVHVSSSAVVTMQRGTDDAFGFYECWENVLPHFGSALGGNELTFAAYGLSSTDQYYATFYNPATGSIPRLSVPHSGVYPDGSNVVVLVTPSYADEAPVNSSVSLWHKEIIGSSSEIDEEVAFGCGYKRAGHRQFQFTAVPTFVPSPPPTVIPTKAPSPPTPAPTLGGDHDKPFVAFKQVDSSDAFAINVTLTVGDKKSKKIYISCIASSSASKVDTVLGSYTTSREAQFKKKSLSSCRDFEVHLPRRTADNNESWVYTDESIYLKLPASSTKYNVTTSHYIYSQSPFFYSSLSPFYFYFITHTHTLSVFSFLSLSPLIYIIYIYIYFYWTCPSCRSGVWPRMKDIEP